MNYCNPKVLGDLFWKDVEEKLLESKLSVPPYNIATLPVESLIGDGVKWVKIGGERQPADFEDLFDIFKASKRYVTIEFDDSCGHDYLFVFNEGGPQLMATDASIEHERGYRRITIQYRPSFKLGDKVVEEAKDLLGPELEVVT